jgi:hypothetical protein
MYRTRLRRLAGNQMNEDRGTGGHFGWADLRPHLTHLSLTADQGQRMLN